MFFRFENVQHRRLILLLNSSEQPLHIPYHAHILLHNINDQCSPTKKKLTNGAKLDTKFVWPNTQSVFFVRKLYMKSKLACKTKPSS